MANTSIKWVELSDLSIVKQIGNYIKHTRLEQNKTQSHLAEVAGLNRWTISQIENGEPVNLMSLIQILRGLDSLHVLNSFEFTDEISPLEYAKLKKKQRQRARNTENSKDDLGW